MIKARLQYWTIGIFLSMFGIWILGINPTYGKNSLAQSLLILEQKSSVEKLLICDRQSLKTDFEYESTGLLSRILYQKPSRLYQAMSSSGAVAINAYWERGQAPHWYVEAQRTGEEAIIGGLIQNNRTAIRAGFRMFDWAFAHQLPDGSFQGTGDSFHSTSFFVASVARTLLLIQQSSYHEQYRDKIQQYLPQLQNAARWMISPSIWKPGMEHNQPYTHRFYGVALALGLTAQLANDRTLMQYAKQSLALGLARQQSNGVNPEKGGADSSYQMAGVVYAQRWMAHFPTDSLTPQVQKMITKALMWERSRIRASGEIDARGNTRTAGQERRRTGEVKHIDHRLVFRGFSYWANLTQDPQWAEVAQKIAQYYYPFNYGIRVVHPNS